jgi:hypothetical protein
MRLPVAALAALLAGGAAFAQEGTELAPEVAPAPEARPEGTSGTQPDDVPQLIPPEDASPVAADPADPEADEAEDHSLTLPEGAEVAPAVEEESSPTLSFPSEQAEGAKSEVPAEPAMREVLAESEAELAACLAELDDLSVTYERVDTITDPEVPGCGITNPIMVSRIAPNMALEPPPTLRCEAALAAARWVADVALPLAAKLPDRGPLVAIDQGTAYLCRPRADGETSEHAYGNALDVMGFRFESGDPIPIELRAGEGTLEEAYQRAVQAGACLDFATVLGPGSDADHADHLHLDVKAREGGFRICE